MELIIIALATARLWRLFALDDWPFDAGHKFRYKVGVRYDVMSNPYGKNALAKGILCTWCSGLWYALILALIVKNRRLSFIPKALAASELFIRGDEIAQTVL